MEEISPEELEKIKTKWEETQSELKSRLILPPPPPEIDKDEISLIGGVDISFIIGDSVNACAAYVVLERNPNSSSSWKPVYQDLSMIRLTAPYIPGFLAFREAQPLTDMIRKQGRVQPELNPDILFVDGNGILHPRRFGLACHIGVELDIPTVGVAKNLHHLPEEGIQYDEDLKKSCSASLLNKGDSLNLISSQDGEILGCALKTCDKSTKPIFLSVGHNISLEKAKRIITEASIYRIPEPTRQADILSREYIRNHFK